MTNEQDWSEEENITINSTSGDTHEGVGQQNTPLVTSIMRYESGDMSEGEVVEFFQHLIDGGLCWSLQGHYGRMASSLIEQGLCHAK